MTSIVLKPLHNSMFHKFLATSEKNYLKKAHIKFSQDNWQIHLLF